MRRCLTYANVMASLAVFMVLGGGAYASTTMLPALSVGATQLRPDAVRSDKIAAGSVRTSDLKSQSVTYNRLSKGVQTLLRARGASSISAASATEGPAGPQGPAGAAGPQGSPGPAGPSGMRSVQTTGSDVADIAGATLASLDVPEATLYILFGSVTLENQGPDQASGGCVLFNGAQQLSAGSGFDLAPGASGTFSLPGLDRVRDSAQPVTMQCSHGGTGPVSASDISLRAVQLQP